jgi:hypothetical protein
MPARRALEERFWEKVNKNGPNGCWVWTASLTSTGYGQIEVDYQKVKAHRVAYKLLVGDIPTDKELDHLCQNPVCVNPEHLQPVSHRDNVIRGKGWAKDNLAKTNCPQGHPYDLINTKFYKNDRQCRTCKRARDLRSYYAKRAAGAKWSRGKLVFPLE